MSKSKGSQENWHAKYSLYEFIFDWKTLVLGGHIFAIKSKTEIN